MTLRINQVGENKFRVIEDLDGRSLILRTLDTRDEAESFAAACGHNPRKK